MLLLLACNENNITDFQPAISVDPAAWDFGAVPGGETASADFVLTNGGRDTLELEKVESSDEDMFWTDLAPRSLKPGEAVGFVVEHLSPGTIALGDLRLSSNDPERPQLTIPLLTGALPPTAEILEPEPGKQEPGVPVHFSGLVEDGDDPLDDLIIQWSSSLQGPLANGVTEFDEVLISGKHTILLEVEDPDGQRASDTVEVKVCSWRPKEEFGSLDLESWTISGDAAWDAGGWLELTGLKQEAMGAAFHTAESFNTAEVDIEVRLATGGGPDGKGADGFSLTLARTDNVALLGSEGGCMGYGADVGCSGNRGQAIKGISIEVDTFPNPWDSTQKDHLGVMVDGDPRTHLAEAELPEVEDLAWHTLRVSLRAPSIQVWWDGALKIDQDLGLSAFDAWIGFTGGTGDDVNYHRVDDLDVQTVCE